MPNTDDMTPEQFAELNVGDKLRTLKDHFDDSIIKAPLTTDREQMRNMLREKLGNEKILWYGQPDPDIVASRSSRMFWWITTLVLVGAIYFTMSFEYCRFVLGAIALVTFYWGFKSPKFERKMAQQTLYAVTENQVVELKCADDKPVGTTVKWFLFCHEKAHLVEPVKQKISSTMRACDVVHSVLEGEDSRSEYKFKAIADADAAIAALQKLRNSKSN